MSPLTDRWRKCGIYTVEYYSTSLKKEGNPDICDMDESEGQNVKWNKAGTERLT